MRFLVPGYTEIKIKQKFCSAKLSKDFEGTAQRKVKENGNLMQDDFSKKKKKKCIDCKSIQIESCKRESTDKFQIGSLKIKHKSQKKAD